MSTVDISSTTFCELFFRDSIFNLNDEKMDHQYEIKS